MGALRKNAPEILQPTQIIIFPVEQARPELIEEPTAWEKFQDSEVGSLVLFELRMFGVTAFLACMIGMIGYFGMATKEASGFEMSDTQSWTSIKHQLGESSWKPSHYLN